jgi:hypothetical protein
MRKIAVAATAATWAVGLGAAVAVAFEWPARKPGQWELAMKANGAADMPAMTLQMCVDASTDKDMMQAGLELGKAMCPDQKIAQEDKLIVITSTCEVGGMKVAGRTEVSGDFQSGYTMRTTGDVSGGPAGMPGKTDMEHTARWVGETCSDGMKPGDLLMPGGIKMNMAKMVEMMKSVGGR